MSKKGRPVWEVSHEEMVARLQKQLNDLLRERASLAETLADQRKRADAIDLDNSRLHKQLAEERRRVYDLVKERDESAGRIRALANLMIAMAPTSPPAPFTDRFPQFQVG